MKNIILLATLFLSFNTLANCEFDTYTHTIYDYDSSMNGQCLAFVKEAMKENGCSEDYISKQSLSEVRSLTQGSSFMCVVETQGGIYQVMASQMAEPNIAVVLFSRLD